MNLPSSGTRISFSGHLGTVRYAGPVDGTSGLWLGVEWDDPQRGKHSGAKDGKQYFVCRPHAGSFIRPSTHVSYGVSFLEALHKKYIDLPHGAASIEKIVLGSSHGAIQVEAANLDKIRHKFSNLTKLRVISLDAQLVSHPDEPGATSNTCPSVLALNLSMSLLPSWEALASITSELPLLESLALNANRFADIQDPSRLSSAFLKVTELQLNKTLTTWTQCVRVMSFMPQLQVVELGYNRLNHLSHVDASNAGILSLETLNLDSNQLGDWVHILQSLQPFLSLTRVILSSNDIQTIPFPQSDHHLLQYSVIKSVSLTSNKLRSWSAIDAIHRWFPTLEALYVRHNPLFQDTELARYSRQLIIAKIPSLKMLDSTNISTRERTDSELFYLSHVAKTEYVDEDLRRREHPQWDVLRNKHGMTGEAIQTRPTHDRMKNRLIELNAYRRLLSLQTLEDIIATPPMKIRVLPSMQLQLLRQKLRKAVKSSADSNDITIWAVMEGGRALAELNSNQNKQDIAWLGLDDDASIVFHVKE